MNRSIHRPAAMGAVAALTLGLLAAVPATGAAAAGSTTALTPAQVRATLSSVLAASESRAVRDGLRLTTTTGDVARDPAGWRDVLTVDPTRGTVQLVDDARGSAPPFKSTPVNPCIPDGSVDRHGRWVWKAGDGRWTRLGLDTDNYERAGAKLAGKPRALWSKRSEPSATLKKLVESYGLREGLDADSDVARLTTGGTSEPTASGTRYVVPFRERGASVDTGVLTLDVSQGGALSAARVRYAADDDFPAFVVSYLATYGAQQVLVPRTWIVKSPALVAGCRAAFARAYPQKLARATARLVNVIGSDDWVGDIRLTARVLNEASEYGVDVKVRKIKHGVRITGRNKLLKHPFVSTVFVRNGKAVAHRVR